MVFADLCFMELRHLRAFVAVAEELSFNQAAKRLRLSQAPLSRMIRALEEEAGMRLLERDRNRQVALTDVGQTFLADARRALATADETLRHAREAASGTRGRLKVAGIAALSVAALPPLLQAFRARHPHVEVFLVEMERAAQLTALRDGHVHVGIYPNLSVPRDRQFQTQPLFACPMVAVLPPGHPQANNDHKSDTLDLHALADDTVLIPAQNYSPGYDERLEVTCRAVGFTPAATHPVEGVPNLLGMVAAGYGVALLPEVLVQGLAPLCRTRPLRAPVPPFRLNLLWRRQNESPVLQQFLAVAKELRQARD
ncbi:LysR family transcriptional regulator [Bradyrhizobium sp.]|uniref:LysR family transcriptional regulator n=1 Tax=Bradyrhizobium sp. TaxID=376 RepID=UPI0025BB0842|nr:LysR substrate-binding domain-containing protein [Bradyrhizobium sp.]